VRDGTGKAEAAKLPDAGISLKQCPEKMSGRKRLAYGSRKIGVAPAETLGQVKRKRKSQLCDDHHRFENGARFEGLLRFAAVTSGWPTIRPESADSLSRNGIRKLPFAFLSTQMVEREELGEEDRPL
jgi:hypothetical protein